ncbi:MAG: DUF3093 domain-containing protein [Propioniciclava sp.]
MLYRERLRVPLSWWFIGLGLGVTTVTAVGFIFGPWASVSAGLVTALVIGAFLAWTGRIVVMVAPEGLRVGSAFIAWSYVGEVTALSVEQARALLGPDADSRAHVVQRPWLSLAVRVAVDDPADPHPYWLVSTRSPAQICAVAERARAAAVAT